MGDFNMSIYWDWYYVFEGSVNSDVVIACFDKFTKNLDKKTVVIIDNASMHTSHAFLDNIDRWEKQNLFIQNIPPYSPELNKIEILWRKIKYEWLDVSAYESFTSLKENLTLLNFYSYIILFVRDKYYARMSSLS